MKQSDVRVGGVYLCYVSGVLTKVEVVSEQRVESYTRKTVQTRYRIRVAEVGKVRMPLPKLRPASALRECDPPIGEKEEREVPREQSRAERNAGTS